MRIPAPRLLDPERSASLAVIEKRLQRRRVMVVEDSGDAIGGSQIELANRAFDGRLLHVDEVRVVEWAVCGEAGVVGDVVDGVGFPVLLPIHAVAIRGV